MTVLANARIVLPEAVSHGWLRIANGRIAELGPGDPPTGTTTGPGSVPDEAGMGAGSVPDRAGSGSGSVPDGPWSGSGEAPSGAPGDAPSGSPADVEVVDLAGRYVVPGFVDLHSHGADGASYQSGKPDDVRRIVAFHEAHGTTTTLASLVTGTPQEMRAAVAGLADLAADGLIAGVHLEGPYLAASRRGAHDPTLLRTPDPAEFAALVEAGRGHIRMITVAPELPGALDLVRAAVAAGVVAAVGHTEAAADQVRQAVEAGARVATHLFNAMRPLHHREGGPVTAALNDSRVTVEVINDGVHVAPDVVKLIFTAAGAGRVALVTDSMAAAGMADGDYTLGTMRVRVQDGRATLAGGSTIAGSTITMADAFRRTVAEVGVPIEQAALAAARTPARALGIDDRVGTLEPGKDADLVVLADDLTVARVMKGGRWR